MTESKASIKYAVALFFALMVMFLMAYFGNEYIEPYHDSLMVIITLFYVIATICISDSNEKSAKAARELLVESKRQFEENKRLEFLPVFKMKCIENSNKIPNFFLRWHKEDSGSICNVNFQIDLLNIGIGTAKDMSFAWLIKDEEMKASPLPVDFMRQNDEQSLTFEITLFADRPKESYTSCSVLRIKYFDLLNNCYYQDVNLDFAISAEEFRLSKCSFNNAIFENKETTNV